MQVQQPVIPSPIRPASVAPAGPAGPRVVVAPGEGAKTFASTLSEALQEVNRLQLQATSNAEQSARGTGPSLNKLMIEGEEAGLAFQTSLQFRNKALEAYQEVMRMQF